MGAMFSVKQELDIQFYGFQTQQTCSSSARIKHPFFFFVTSSFQTPHQSRFFKLIKGTFHT
jgi:hypothetical protein